MDQDKDKEPKRDLVIGDHTVPPFQKDAACKRLLFQNSVIAPMVDAMLFGKEAGLSESSIREMDPVRQAAFARFENGEEKLLYQETIRDIFKVVSFTKNVQEEGQNEDRTLYILVGIEAQSYPCYEMALRAASYDLMDYRRQAEDLYRKRHMNGRNSRFRLTKGDLLDLTVTLVVWFSPDPWPGPRNLNELIRYPEGFKAEKISYPLYLIEPYAMSDEDLMKLGPDLGSALVMIKRSGSRQELEETMIKYKKEFSAMSIVAANAVNAAVDLGLRIREENIRNGGTVNMCGALEEYAMQVRMAEEGKRRAEESLRKVEDNARQTACNLYRIGMPVAKISEVMNQKEETIHFWIESREMPA